MIFRVRKGECATPGATEDLPPLDVAMLAKSLDVSDQVPGGVRTEIGFGFTGVRPALAATALIEQYDAIACRVEQPPDRGLEPSARPAVQEDNRLAGRIATLFPVNLLTVADIQHAGGVRLDRWIKRS